MMKGKLSSAKWLTVECHLAVGNPNAFPFYIYFTSRRIAGGFFGARAWKERTVKHGEFRLVRWIGNNGREKARILVVHITEFDAFARRKSSKSQTPPMEKIFRHSRAIRGPWNDHAVYVIRYRCSGSINVTRGSSQPPLPSGRSS